MDKPEKLLVKCSYCQEHGTVSVLGEVQKNDVFEVMRFHKGTTKIIAENFIIICGVCDHPQYVRGTYAPE